MTDTDLRSEIAEIRTTLRHIEATLERNYRESETRSAQLADISGRLRLVEAAGVNVSDLPRQVHETQITNAVQDAVRNERAEVMGQMGRLIMIGGAVLGVVFSAVQIGISVYL